MKASVIGWIVTTLIAITGGVVLPLYFNLHRERVVLEIRTVSVRFLTQPAATSDLKVQYFYKDTIPVQNLWQVRYIIRNIGDETIAGVDDGRELSYKNLPFAIESADGICSVEITQSDNGAVLDGNLICFKQWRSGEFVEVTVLAEGSEAPQLTISDRDIKDSEIVYR